MAKLNMLHSSFTPTIPLFRRLGTSLAIASTSLLLTAGSAFAGTAEQNALIIELAKQDVTLGTATGDQLAAAVDTVITAHHNFKPGVVAGEALKGAGSNAPDAGSKIAAKVKANSAVTVANAFQVAADAAKTAATGKAPNLTQVPTFEQLFATTVPDAIAIANKVKTVTSAVGAIIGGEALNLSGDAAKLGLANSALHQGLAGSAQSISQYVGLTVTDTANFARNLSDQNIPSTIKITPGVVAADPTHASNIVSAIVNDVSLSSVLKKAATLATNVAKVADIEEIRRVGEVLGAKIATSAIPISQLNAIAKGLVAGISGKPTTTTGANRQVNKIDEIGEVGAYLTNAIATNTAFQGTTAQAGTKAANLVINLLKTIVARSKSNVDVALQTLVAPDVSGSVALTILNLDQKNLISQTVADAIKAALLKPATGKTIGGSALAASINAAINLVYTPGSDTHKFEDGTNAIVGALNDPESDDRG
jgi:hypothetical protein